MHRCFLGYAKGLLINNYKSKENEFFMNTRDAGLMTEGSIAKKILLFSVPLILGNLLQQLYSTADSVIVGNFVGSNALAAVGASTSLINLLIGFSQGAAVGAGVVVSQYIGANKKREIHIAVHTAMAIALLIGIVLTVGGVLSARTLLRLMNTPSEVLDDAALYLRIYLGGTVFNIIYNMASGILNSVGNSKRSLIYLAYASVTNIVLDIIFVGAMHMGVAGAAIATDISQLVSGAFAVLYLTRVDADHRIELRKIRMHKNMAKRIVRIGLPTGIQNMVISFSNVLVQSSVNVFGTAAVAGFGAYMKIDGFNILPVLSFSMAATTFVGQNYGAGRLDRVKRGTWVTLAMGWIYTIITGIMLLTFSDQLMGLFTKDQPVIEYGERAMLYFCPFYCVLSTLHCLAGTVRGTGRSIPPMLILLTSMCLLRIVWIKTVVPHFDTIDGIFLLYPVTWFIGAGMMIAYTCRGKWLQPQ